MVNIIGADVLAMQGAMVLTLLSRNNSVPASEGLR